MFKKDLKKINSKFNKHKETINERSKNWGKTKFKPNAFRSNLSEPVSEETAQPWNHVRNDILDDEHEQRNMDRFDMNSQQAKEFRRQREQNHRRSIIETSRNAKTTWETFNDDNVDGTSKPKKRQFRSANPKTSIMENPQNLSFKERNYLRRKLTKAVLSEKKSSLESAINDMQRTSVVRNWVKTKDNNPFHKNSKFRDS